MILTTANDVAGKTIVEYKGIACGEAITPFSNSFQRTIINHENFSSLRSQAFTQLQTQAENLGANAVIAISVEIVLVRDIFPVIHVSGTAVVVE
ncbi:heavy metal-binding domain-containing protein [Culicoidibacter larvae]|uniref:YbjQ family protein n=1 Tax=Culicoidibacter larvae TaxID=2579976 RepID=A0A5R8QCC7_9FIRM|nr:heavy metal-binding domain-containing protein [Culicoidibacter larvae]TLG73926.1 YbjQ family protein [Culicoidibacter larvae]